MNHKWIFVPPAGMYENEYRCDYCGDINMESADNPDTNNSVDGCSGELLEVPTCDKCGGQDIQVDAYAAYNPITQDWEIVTTFDQSVCEDCGGECSWEMQKIKPPCQHEFVSADNEHVSGASICTKCKLIMATSDVLALEQKITNSAGIDFKRSDSDD